MNGEDTLVVEDLSIDYVNRHDSTRAVDGVSFVLKKREIVGVVGESACGKSTLALAIMRLVPSPGKVTSGRVLLEGRDLLGLDEEDMRNVRGNSMSMIVQDTLATMNPVSKIGAQVIEIVKDHEGGSRKSIRSRAIAMLEAVRLPLPEQIMEMYPHQLSGGMQQRVAIAEGLILGPKLIIADEPTTALDVTIQAQILQLLLDARDSYDTSVLFITHDLAIVAEICDRVLVMYAGSIVESGGVLDIFANPRHPYTRALLDGLLPLRGEPPTRLQALGGHPPRPEEWPSGCRFHPRCPLSAQLGHPEICRTTEPILDDVTDHRAACHFSAELGASESGVRQT